MRKINSMRDIKDNFTETMYKIAEFEAQLYDFDEYAVEEFVERLCDAFQAELSDFLAERKGD